MLSISLRQEGPVCVVQLAGELTLESVGKLEAVVRPNPDTTRELVVDCAELHFLDSSGIGELIQLFRRCRAADVDARITNVQDYMFETLSTLGVLDFLKVGVPQ